jgi:hypothetical protein
MKHLEDVRNSFMEPRPLVEHPPRATKPTNTSAVATTAAAVQESERLTNEIERLSVLIDHLSKQKKAAVQEERKAAEEAEEQARKEAEEQARKEAEEQARKEAGEQARKEAEEQARKEAEGMSMWAVIAAWLVIAWSVIAAVLRAHGAWRRNDRYYCPPSNETQPTQHIAQPDLDSPTLNPTAAFAFDEEASSLAISRSCDLEVITRQNTKKENKKAKKKAKKTSQAAVVRDAGASPRGLRGVSWGCGG